MRIEEEIATRDKKETRRKRGRVDDWMDEIIIIKQQSFVFFQLSSFVIAWSSAVGFHLPRNDNFIKTLFVYLVLLEYLASLGSG